MLFNTIKHLCKHFETNISRLETALGIAKSSIMRWETAMPRIDNVQKVADYFKVSVDFLLEGKEDENYEEFIERYSEYESKRENEERRTNIKRRDIDKNDSALLSALQEIIKTYGGEQLSPETKKIPIVGTIKCGTNGIAYEDISSYLLVDESLHGELFVLRVKGDSMTGKGIEENDLAIIRKQEELESGEIGAFLIDGEEATLKRYAVLPNGVALEAANSNYPTRYFMNDDATRVRVLGKLVEIRKRY